MKLVETRTYYDGLEFCIKVLRNRQVNLDASKIIIVPDRFSFETEEAVFSSLKEKGAFDVEVLTLNRLCIRLDRSGRDYLNSEGAVMAVAGILKRNKDNLCYFKNTYRRLACASEIYNTIMQLQASGINSTELKPIGTSLLQKKLRDIKLIYSEYEAFSKERYTDASARLKNASEFLEKADWVKRADFFVLGFDRMTVSAVRFLRELDRHCSSLIINTVKPPIGQDGACEGLKETVLPIFREGKNAKINSANAEKSFNALASFNEIAIGQGETKGSGNETAIGQDEKKSSKNEIEIIELAGTLSEFKEHIYQNFFTFPPKRTSIESRDEYIRLHEAENAESATEHACRLISRYVYKNGFRYRDIGIIASALSETSRAVFRRFGIPINSSEAFSLKAHPLIRFLCSALECINGNFARRDVLSFVGNFYNSLTADEYAVFENYCAEFSVDYSRFLNEFSLGRTDRNDNPRMDFSDSERIRGNIVKKLTDFSKELKECNTYLDFSFCCMRFLSRTEFEKKLPSDACGNEFLSFNAQVPKLLERFFNSLRLSMGTERASLSDFIDILKCGLEGYEASVAPADYDAVNVFDFESFRMKKYKVLIYLNLNEGILPPLRDDAGLLSDRDIDELASLGQDVKPKIRHINSLSRLALFDTFFLSSRLHLLTLKNLMPSHFFLTMQRLTGQKISSGLSEREYALRCSDENKASDFLEYYLPDLKSAKSFFYTEYALLKQASIKAVPFSLSAVYNYLTYSRSLAPLEKMLDKSGSDFGLVPEAGTLFFKDNTVSVSRLESYFSCPFRHFIKYGLRAEPAREGRLKPLDIGLALHFMAEQYVSALIKNQAPPAPKDILERYFSENEYVNPSASVLRVLESESEKLCNTIQDDLNNSKYRPFKTELKFGLDGEYGGLKLFTGKREVELQGFIDRADINGENIRIIDYKTGSVTLDYSDIVFGRRIQMAVYLRALEKAGFKGSAGLYMPVNNDYKKGGASLSYLGFIKEDASECMAMDTRLGLESPKSHMLNISLKAEKDKSISLKPSRLTLKTEALKNMLSYTERLCEIAVGEMEKGYIAPSPIQKGRATTCVYCECRNMCPKGLPRRAVSHTKKFFAPKSDNTEDTNPKVMLDKSQTESTADSVKETTEADYDKMD